VDELDVQEMKTPIKRLLYVAAILGFVSVLAGVWFWFAGWTHRSSIVGQITRIQYFESPALVAIHIDSPAGVFVIPTISGHNQEDFAKWLNPANVELESLSIIADSTYDKWADQFTQKDSIQFGVHGLPRGDTKPNYGGKVAVGIAQEGFAYKSFQFMTEEEFARLPVGNKVNESAVFGRLNFSRYFHVSPKEKPFIIP
jgi:hypothetical protein